jgi:hypothetical protein
VSRKIWQPSAPVPRLLHASIISFPFGGKKWWIKSNPSQMLSTPSSMLRKFTGATFECRAQICRKSKCWKSKDRKSKCRKSKFWKWESWKMLKVLNSSDPSWQHSAGEGAHRRCW